MLSDDDDVPSEEMLQAAKSQVYTETRRNFLAGDFSEEANPLNTALLKSPCLREMFSRCLAIISTTANSMDIFSCLLTFFLMGLKVGRAQMVKLDETSLNTDKQVN